jgi:hypothetical protein
MNTKMAVATANRAGTLTMHFLPDRLHLQLDRLVGSYGGRSLCDCIRTGSIEKSARLVLMCRVHRGQRRLPPSGKLLDILRRR